MTPEELEAALRDIAEGCEALAQLRDARDEEGVPYLPAQTEGAYRKIFSGFEALRRLPLTPEERGFWQEAQDHLYPARGPAVRAIARAWSDRARLILSERRPLTS